MRIASVCLSVLLVAQFASAEVKSGLTVGESVAPYYVLDVTGPSAGEKLCYRCQYSQRPVVNIFARDVDKNVAALIKKLDAQLSQKKDLRGFVTILTDDTDAAERKLKNLADKEGIKNLPLTVFEGKSGPSEYKISEDAEVTVLLWTRSQVKANHAFAKGELNEKGITAVVADIPKLLK